jgi:hypothetical protein
MGMKLTVVCILLLMAGVGISSDPDSSAGGRGSKSVATGDEAVKDSNGPGNF